MKIVVIGGTGLIGSKVVQINQEAMTTLSNLSRTVLVALGLALFATPSASLAQSRSGQELVNRPYWSGHPYWSGYGPLTNYDREVNGSDASTPGHN